MILPYELIFPLEDFPIFEFAASPASFKFGEVNGLAEIQFDALLDWKLASVVIEETPSWDEAAQSWRDRKVRIEADELDWPKRRLFNWIQSALERNEAEILEGRMREILEWDEEE